MSVKTRRMTSPWFHRALASRQAVVPVGRVDPRGGLQPVRQSRLSRATTSSRIQAERRAVRCRPFAQAGPGKRAVGPSRRWRAHVRAVPRVYAQNASVSCRDRAGERGRGSAIGAESRQAGRGPVRRVPATVRRGRPWPAGLPAPSRAATGGPPLINCVHPTTSFLRPNEIRPNGPHRRGVRADLPLKSVATEAVSAPHGCVAARSKFHLKVSVEHLLKDLQVASRSRSEMRPRRTQSGDRPAYAVPAGLPRRVGRS